MHFDGMTQRRTGRTSVLLAGIKQSPDAVLIVAHNQDKQQLIQENPDLRNRIWTADQITVWRTRGRMTPILYDHYASEQIAAKANEIEMAYGTLHGALQKANAYIVKLVYRNLEIEKELKKYKDRENEYVIEHKELTAKFAGMRKPGRVKKQLRRLERLMNA